MNYDILSKILITVSVLYIAKVLFGRKIKRITKKIVRSIIKLFTMGNGA